MTLHKEQKDSTRNIANSETRVIEQDSTHVQTKKDDVQNGIVVEFDTNDFAGPDSSSVTISQEDFNPVQTKEYPITNAIAKAIQSGKLKPKRVIFYNNEQHRVTDSGKVLKSDSSIQVQNESTHVSTNVTDKHKEKKRSSIPFFGIIASLGLFLLILLLANKTVRNKALSFFGIIKTFILKLIT